MVARRPLFLDTGMDIIPRNRLQASSSRLRLQTLLRLRWIAVTGQLVAVLGTRFGLGFALPLLWCLIVIGVSAAFNAGLRLWFPARHRLSVGFGTAMLIYDMAQLAGLLWLTGGIENPFCFLLVAPATVAAATLPMESTAILGILTPAVAAVIARYHLPLPWYADQPFSLPGLYTAGIWTSIVCGLVFIGLYARRLAREARQMSEALAATELVLSREQRLHALDGLAAAAAHELGTPLGTITVVVREIERGLLADSPLKDDVSLLRSQVQRCREILKTLTERSAEGDPLHTWLPLSHLIEEAIEPYRVFEKEIRVTAGPAPGLDGKAAEEPVSERRPGVVYGLTNLVENAVDFASRAVDIVAGWTADRVTITIADDGPGFPHSILSTLGEPYVTTRGAPERSPSEQDHGGGLGLGFFIAKTLLERSGAEIEIANREPAATGAVVQISWRREVFESRVPPDERLRLSGAA
jgi:two-component system sensor histidine kinase RegB